MRPGRLVVVVCLAVPALAACGPGPGPVDPATPPSYTCCEQRDVERRYQPGQTLTLHWTVTPGRGRPPVTPQAELTARLTGPYPDAAALKAQSSGPEATGELSYPAATVRPTGAADERPVSVIQVGTDALPGYYNLTWSATEGHGRVSGASVVQVVAS